ncbi:acyl carrier protein 1 [Roseburia sp. CAG:309]|nr:acyl carrier protein 1 [Roseburia sp. CAG:309]
MLEKMQELIADQLSVDADSITEASSFKDDLGADSLDLYELIMALEEEYDVEIPTDDLESINTVGDVINFLKDKDECSSKRKRSRIGNDSPIFLISTPVKNNTI